MEINYQYQKLKLPVLRGIRECVYSTNSELETIALSDLNQETPDSWSWIVGSIASHLFASCLRKSQRNLRSCDLQWFFQLLLKIANLPSVCDWVRKCAHFFSFNFLRHYLYIFLSRTVNRFGKDLVIFILFFSKKFVNLILSFFLEDIVRGNRKKKSMWDCVLFSLPPPPIYLLNICLIFI